MICDGDHKESLAYINAELNCSENCQRGSSVPNYVRASRIVSAVKMMSARNLNLISLRHCSPVTNRCNIEVLCPFFLQEKKKSNVSMCDQGMAMNKGKSDAMFTLT